MHSEKGARHGFCIYINDLCEGAVPVERNAAGYPIAYSTIEESQKIIAEDAIERLHQFLEGQRDFDDAMTVEEFIVDVDLLPDGSIVDIDDNHSGPIDALVASAAASDPIHHK